MFWENFARLCESAGKTPTGVSKELGLPDHLPHDTRYTCATLMHRAKVDLLTRKRILGHAVTDITEGVYTDTADAELLAAIDSI